MHKAFYIFKLLSEIILSWQTCQNQLRAWWNEMDVLSEEYFLWPKISVEKKVPEKRILRKKFPKEMSGGGKTREKESIWWKPKTEKTKAWLINQARLNQSLA